MSETVGRALELDALQEPLPPPLPERPEHRLPPREWVRANLFSTPINAVLTVVFGMGLAWAGFRLARFVLVSADWEVVRRNLRLFMVGRFPASELWRLWVSLYLVCLAVGLSFGAAASAAEVEAVRAGRRPEPVSRSAAVLRFWPVIVAVVVILSFTRSVTPGLLLAGAVAVLLAGQFLGRTAPPAVTRFAWLGLAGLLIAAYLVITAFDGVSKNDWGGLHLTVFVTVAGIVLAFPLGLVLALGRRSTLPAIRWLTVAYIEVFRGVPLVALLLMGQFMIGFFFPTYLDPPDTLTRALIAIVLFEAAYIAEVVRGGLQSIPRGQYEAAQALGLKPWTTMRRVVMPQALRAVIPAIVGQFISLFKDTSLLAIVSFLELLSVAQVVLSQADFQARGLEAVTLTFAAFIYWVGCYTMSKESRRLERRLGIGVR